MGQPTWRQIKIVTVPERGGVIWTPALDYLTPGKLYRIRVEPRTLNAKPEAPDSVAGEAFSKAAEATGDKVASVTEIGNSPEMGKQPGPVPFREAANAAPKVKTVDSSGTSGPHSPATVDATAPRGSSKGLAGPLQRLRDQYWKPESGADCSADGDPALKRQSPLLMPNGVVGALIGKIGGSAGDTDFDKDKVVLFTVGRHCVFVAPEAPKVGSLYLGINDTAASAAKVEKDLEATIWEAL